MRQVERVPGSAEKAEGGKADKEIHTISRCGLHSDAIRRYERGEAEPDIKSLISIANFFEVSLDYLMGRADYR